MARAATNTCYRAPTPSDEARAAEIHILVYNLYLPNQGRRAVKRR